MIADIRFTIFLLGGCAVLGLLVLWPVVLVMLAK